MNKSIDIPYKSGWFTVVLPTLIFLTVWLGSFLLPPALLDRNVSDTVGALLCLGGIPLGFIAAAISYPYLQRLADRGRGILSLEDTILRWRTGSRRSKTIDLAQPHFAKIDADSTCTGLTLQTEENLVNLYFDRLSRQKVLDSFPAPHFIGELVVTPAMGSWGFEATADDPLVEDFAIHLLRILWRQRRKNRYFLLYEKFPWNRTPRPAFSHIRLIEWENRSAEEEAWIAHLEQQFIDGLEGSYVRLTPDYLMGRVYRSMRSKWSGRPDYYCVMPLGYIHAETSLPHPDWKPFIIGNVLKEALATALGTTAPAGGPYLEDRYYLYVRGRGADHTPMELAFDWYEPVDEEYREAELVVRFVSAMRRLKRTAGKTTWSGREREGWTETNVF